MLIKINSIIKKKGDGFLFSCWNNKEQKLRLQFVKHTNFLLVVQIAIGL